MSQLSFPTFDVALLVRDTHGRYELASADQMREALMFRAQGLGAAVFVAGLLFAQRHDERAVRGRSQAFRV